MQLAQWILGELVDDPGLPIHGLPLPSLFKPIEYDLSRSPNKTKGQGSTAGQCIFFFWGGGPHHTYIKGNPVKWNHRGNLLSVFNNCIFIFRFLRYSQSKTYLSFIWPVKVTPDKENGPKWNLMSNFLFIINSNSRLIVHGFPVICHNSPDTGLREQRWPPCHHIGSELKNP